MMDPNAYNIDAYNAGTTNGVVGLADGTGYFGASADTNDIFGRTLTTNTDTTDFGGVQTLGVTTGAYDPNLYGGAQVLPGTVTDVNALYGQTTDMGDLYGTTPGITAFNPDGNVGYGTNGTYGTTLNNTNLLPGTTTTATTTTTTTQTTYDTNGVITSPGVVAGVNDLTTYGTPIDYTVPTALPVTTAVPAATAVTTVTQPVATLPPPVVGVTPPVVGVTPPVVDVTPPVVGVTPPVVGVTPPVVGVTPPVVGVTPPVAAVATPVPTVNPLLTGPPLLRNNLPYYASPDGQILQTRYGQKILDEDFRRGRPLYNYVIGQKLLIPNNIAIRPSNNIGLTNNHLVYDYPNNLALKRNNLDRLGRGGSYDVYGRGITPLLNKVGLGTVETQPRLKDFL